MGCHFLLPGIFPMQGWELHLLHCRWTFCTVSRQGSIHHKPHAGLSMGLPSVSMVKNPPANAGDVGSIPGWGRSPGEGNGDRFQYPCLRNPMDRGTWWATARGWQRVQHALATKQQQAMHTVYLWATPAWVTHSAHPHPGCTLPCDTCLL